MTPINKIGRGRPKGTKNNKLLPLRETGLKPSFKAIFGFIGNILSAQFLFDGFKVSDNESEMLSIQADQVVVEFVPEVGGKWIKLGIFITSIITIYAKKWFDYEIKKKKDKPPKKVLEQISNKPTNSNCNTAHVIK